MVMFHSYISIPECNSWGISSKIGFEYPRGRKVGIPYDYDNKFGQVWKQ